MSWRCITHVGFGVVVGLVLLVAGAGSSAAASDAASPPPPGSAVQTFTSCLNSSRPGDLLLLIDESHSLVDTDPGAARVTAARYLLSRLSTFADRTKFRLNVAVAGFSDAFDMASRWSPLGAMTLPALTRQVDAFADRNQGVETDYLSALEGARRALADQAQPGTASRCQAIAWFSDGQLDLTGQASPAADAAAEAAAVDALCRPSSGLADQLRASGVVLFGMGLLGRNSHPGDFDLMRAISTGESPSRPCGRPSTRTPGDFHLAENIDDLLFAFDAMVPPGPPISQTRRTCPVAVCASERHSFVLDSSVSKVEILGTVDREGVRAALVPPSGAPIPLGPTTVGKPFTVTRGPSTVSFFWLSDRTVSVDLVSQSRSGGWSGEWALVFVDPTPRAPVRSRTNIHVTGDLRPAWTNRPPVLHSEQSIPATFGLVDGAGRAVTPSSVLGDLSLRVVLAAPGRSPVTVVNATDKAGLDSPTALDLRAIPPGPATLRLTLDVRTAPAIRADGTRVDGTRLAPSSLELPLQIAPPLGYPQVGDEVNFGRSNGETTLTGTLGVIGPGCVWAAPVTPEIESAPQDAGRITVEATGARDARTCLRIGPGRQGRLELRLTTERVGNGTVTGSLPVMVAPPGDPGAARQVLVTFTADLRKPLDEQVFWQVVIALVLLGVGLPLGLFYLAKWATARIPARPLLAGRIPVTVTDGQVRRFGVPFRLDQRDLDQQVPIPVRGGRDLVAHGVRLRAQTGWSPFGAGHVVACVPDGRTRAAADQQAPSQLSDEARLPLAIHNTWLVLHDPTGPADQAEVLVLVSGDDPTGRLRSRLETTIADHLPRVLARMRADHPQQTVTSGMQQGPPPFGEPYRPPDPTGASPFDLGPSQRGGPTPPHRTTPGDHW